MIVVDTVLLAAFCLTSPHSETAERVWKKDSLWHAPPLIFSEFRSVLNQYVARGLANSALVSAAIVQARTTLPDAKVFEPDDLKILDLAARSGCSPYDCEFIAVAEMLDAPLVTWNPKLLEAFPQTAVRPEAFIEAEVTSGVE